MASYKTPNAQKTKQSEFKAKKAEKSEKIWIYGHHAVRAVLNNPARKVSRFLVAEENLYILEELITLGEAKKNIFPEIKNLNSIGNILPRWSVHQGVAVFVQRLKSPKIEDVCSNNVPDPNIVIVLDQVTDPHNLGAIIRSAAAFGARAVIIQDRHSPLESGLLAKVSSGGIENLPLIRTVNLSRALRKLAELGYWRIALQPDASEVLNATNNKQPVALILGSEGKGIRRSTLVNCDLTAKLNILHKGPESLNVSVATSVALYEYVRGYSMKSNSKLEK